MSASGPSGPLVSVAEETVLEIALSETLKTGFVATRPILWSLLFQ